MDNQYLSVLTQLPMAFGLFRGEQYIIEIANDKALELWGKSREQVLGKPVFEVFPELLEQGFAKILEGVYKHGHHFEAKEQPVVLRRYGTPEIVYINFSYDPIRNQDGVIDSFITVGHDVTETVKAKIEAKEAYAGINLRTALLEAQQEVTPDGILMVDTEGNILSYNKKFVEVWNMSPTIVDTRSHQNALNHAMLQVTHPDKFLKRVKEILNKQDDSSYDELHFKDGRVIERHGAKIIGIDGIEYGWAWYFRDVSERRLQELRLKTILDSLPQMAWTAYPDGRIEYLNKRWYEYTGQTEEEAFTNGWSLALEPSMTEMVFRKWKEAVAHQTNYEVELKYRNTLGEYRWHLSRAVPILTDGKVALWVGTCTDIHTFKELQDSLKLQSQVLENMSEGVSISDENGYILFTNPAEDRMFGYKANELIGQHVTVQNVYSTEENEQRVQSVLAQLRQSGTWTGEWHNKRKDGSTFYTYARITAIENGGKKLLLCVQRDITDEKLQHEQYDYQHMLMSTIAENATSTLFMMDKNGYCTFMNAAGEKMFGYTQEEIRSKPLHYMIHHHRPDGSFYPMHECPIDRALPENFDVRAHHDLFFRKDGTRVYVSCAASPIFENGVPISTVIEVRDIGLQIEAEQALRRSAQELELLVQQRTEDLKRVNLQLREAQDVQEQYIEELKRSNDELEQFVYVASHDLQEPLRKITFFNDMLASKLEPEHDLRRYVEKVDTSARRLRGLIKSLLDYSRLSNETLRFVAVDLNQVVNAVLNDFELLIEQKNAVVTTSDLPVIQAIPIQMSQLFFNLVGNALKFTKKDVQPKIAIAATPLAPQEIDDLPLINKQGKYIRITVQDNGIGFNQEYASKIFSIFQRLNDKSMYGGYGIGLALCKKVADVHKGLIWAEGKSKVGATFTVILPVKQIG